MKNKENKQLIRKGKLDTEEKENAYLKMCLSLSYEERIAFLERLNQNLIEIFLANPANQQLIKQENGVPARLQGLSKSFRKI